MFCLGKGRTARSKMEEESHVRELLTFTLSVEPCSRAPSCRERSQSHRPPRWTRVGREVFD